MTPLEIAAHMTSGDSGLIDHGDECFIHSSKGKIKITEDERRLISSTNCLELFPPNQSESPMIWRLPFDSYSLFTKRLLDAGKRK